MEIIVVDNHSTDGSLAYLSSRFERVRFISLAHNPGFAASCNIGLRESRGRYVLFLNPDTIIPEDLFTFSLDFFHQHPEAGAIGYRMIDGEGRYLRESKRGFPGLWAGFCRFTLLADWFPTSAWFASYYLGHLPERKPAAVDVLSGAALMVPDRVLEKTGSFDERFFMYGEDIDLSYRIQRAGYINYYRPEISLIHFKGESTVRNPQYYQRFFGAMRLFVEKYARGPFSSIRLTLTRGMITLIQRAMMWRGVTTLPDPKRPESFRVMGEEVSGVARSFDSINCLLCTGPHYTYQQCIADLESRGRRYRCFIHAIGSGSIVGASGAHYRGLSFRLPAD